MRGFDRLDHSLPAIAGLALLAIGTLGAGPARGEPPVSFAKDVKPVLQEYCVECHQPGGKGYEANGLDLRSYAGVMKGSKLGPVVVPGDVFTSNLLRAVLGQVNSAVRMPFHKAEMPDKDSTRLLRWIYQGAPDN